MIKIGIKKLMMPKIAVTVSSVLSPDELNQTIPMKALIAAKIEANNIIAAVLTVLYKNANSIMAATIKIKMYIAQR